MPVMMKLMPIATTIRAMTRVMTLMSVLPMKRSIGTDVQSVRPTKNVGRRERQERSAEPSRIIVRERDHDAHLGWADRQREAKGVMAIPCISTSVSLSAALDCMNLLYCA
jgi:hypothetical protein